MGTCVTFSHGRADLGTACCVLVLVSLPDFISLLISLSWTLSMEWIMNNNCNKTSWGKHQSRYELTSPLLVIPADCFPTCGTFLSLQYLLKCHVVPVWVLQEDNELIWHEVTWWINYRTPFSKISIYSHIDNTYNDLKIIISWLNRNCIHCLGHLQWLPLS